MEFMKKIKILILLLIALFLFPAYSFSFSKAKNEIEELRREITLLNLINGLNLTDHQSKELLKYAEEAKAIRDSAKKEYNLMETALKTALAELRDNLYDKNSRPHQEIERHAGKLNHIAKEKKEETIRQLREIEEKVKSVLTPGQIEIVQDFKPCLIPPKDLKNPTRAGQAFDSSPVEKLLERARTIPDTRYANAKYWITERYIKRLESHLGHMTDAEKDAKLTILLETMDKARMMSDEEFALSKKELALQIEPDNERKESKKAFEFERSRKGLGYIGRFLLDEKVITILQKRLETSEGQSYTGSIGLLNLEEGDEGRSCALKTL